jgi:hypothetical protein
VHNISMPLAQGRALVALLRLLSSAREVVLTPLVDELLQHVQLLHSTLTVLDDASDAQLQLLRLYEDAILNARDGVLEALLREAARQLHAVGVPSYESYQYVAQTLFNALGVALSHRVIKYDGLCDTFSISGQPVPRIYLKERQMQTVYHMAGYAAAGTACLSMSLYQTQHDAPALSAITRRNQEHFWLMQLQPTSCVVMHCAIRSRTIHNANCHDYQSTTMAPLTICNPIARARMNPSLNLPPTVADDCSAPMPDTRRLPPNAVNKDSNRTTNACVATGSPTATSRGTISDTVSIAAFATTTPLDAFQVTFFVATMMASTTCINKDSMRDLPVARTPVHVKRKKNALLTFVGQYSSTYDISDAKKEAYSHARVIQHTRACTVTHRHIGRPGGCRHGAQPSSARASRPARDHERVYTD